MNRLDKKEFWNKYRILAKYKCRKCKKRWEQQPQPTICPRCSNIWVDWLNSEEVLKKINAERRKETLGASSKDPRGKD